MSDKRTPEELLPINALERDFPCTPWHLKMMGIPWETEFDEQMLLCAREHRQVMRFLRMLFGLVGVDGKAIFHYPDPFNELPKALKEFVVQEKFMGHFTHINLITVKADHRYFPGDGWRWAAEIFLEVSSCMPKTLVYSCGINQWGMLFDYATIVDDMTVC